MNMSKKQSAGRYTEAEKATMISSLAKGDSWVAIGELLGRTPEGCQRTAHRMRDRGEWPDDEKSVRVLPRGPGRPANREPSSKVSPRISSDVSTALRQVAGANGLRLGQLTNLAVHHYLKDSGRTAAVRRRSTAAFAKVQDLAAEPIKIAATPRPETMSVSILAADFDAITACAAKAKQSVSTLLAHAMQGLLVDLGYTIAGAP